MTVTAVRVVDRVRSVREGQASPVEREWCRMERHTVAPGGAKRVERGQASGLT